MTPTTMSFSSSASSSNSSPHSLQKLPSRSKSVDWHSWSLQVTIWKVSCVIQELIQGPAKQRECYWSTIAFSEKNKLWIYPNNTRTEFQRHNWMQIAISRRLSRRTSSVVKCPNVLFCSDWSLLKLPSMDRAQLQPACSSLKAQAQSREGREWKRISGLL